QNRGVIFYGKTKRGVAWEIIRNFDSSGTYNSTRKTLIQWLKTLDEKGKGSLASNTGKDKGKSSGRPKKRPKHIEDMSREELIDYIEIIEITNEILRDTTRKQDKFLAMHFLKNKKLI
ncbi:MAG: hypothetical protein KAG14_01870, partial [Mycoplasmataceae bacterium]|nr:hypothetical protein [Mycoplasmataceae bacterium]